MMYSIPYLLLLVFFGLCAYSFELVEDEQRKRQYTIASIVVFYIFFAFRGYLYTDWISYVEFFESVEWKDLYDFNAEKMYEPGFVLVCLFSKSIIPHYFFLVFVCMTIDILLFLRFLKRWEIKNVAFAFLLFVVFEGLVIMFNLLRNAISLFLFMNALEYVEKRKPLPYFLLCLLALSFHLTSIIFFPLYFFIHRKTNRWVFLGVFLACFVLYLSKVSVALLVAKILGMGDLFTTKIEAYTERMTSSRELSLTGTLEKAAITILTFLYYDEILEKFKGRIIIINCLLIYFFMYYMLADFRILSSRFATLFVFSYWVIWIDLTKILFVKNNRRLLACLLFLYCSYVIKANINVPLQEYDNILFGHKSYEERVLMFNRTYKADE